MGHIWGERIASDAYRESTFRRGFELLRGRLVPESAPPSLFYDQGDGMPPLDMPTILRMADEPAHVTWAHAVGIDAVAPTVADLGADPHAWDPDYLYGFCKDIGVHPACLMMHENGVALPLPVVHALQLALLDENVTAFDRKMAANALQVEATNARNIVMEMPIIAQLALTARRWCNFMAAHEGEHDPYMTAVGQKASNQYFEAAQAMAALQGRDLDVWACLPGMRSTLQEMADSKMLRYEEATRTYNATALHRASLGLALFGPKHYQEYASDMLANRSRFASLDAISDYFNDLAYMAVTAPEILSPQGLDDGAGWRARKMGYVDVPDMALAFVRAQEKVMTSVYLETSLQMQQAVLERVTRLVDGAFDFTPGERALLEAGPLRAMRNLEAISGEVHGLYPLELDLIFPVPERLAITGPAPRAGVV